MGERTASLQRETEETTIAVRLDIDGDGDATIDTGIGFFDHMLEQVAVHGLFDLTIDASGDLDVDVHHTVEDVGIVLGQALDTALGDRAGIVRYADRRLPMDESLAEVAVDVSGRPVYRFEGEFSQDSVGGMTSQLASHFWHTVAMNASLTAHASVRGENAHHEVEALFKAFARTLDAAVAVDECRSGAPSTKGTIE